MLRASMESKPVWSKLRVSAIASVSAVLLLFGLGFAVSTHPPMPDYALVFIDDASQAYLAPQCLGDWQRRQNARPAHLRRGTAGEARGLSYTPDARCARTSAFHPDGPSLSRLALEKLGLIGARRLWWDVPYRTEDGMVYPPNTHA